MGHREYVDPLLNEVTYAFQLFAMFSAYVFNIILIFIVQRTSNKEIGTYRILITYFALSDMYYNTVHFIVYPIPENYGNAFIMGGHGYYPELLGVGMYMGAYGHTFPILIFHFLYRLFAFKYPQYLAYFPAFIFALIVSTAAFNGIWFSIFYGLFHPDDVTLRTLAPVFYGSIPLPIAHSIETAAKHSQALYWTDGTFDGPRWNNLLGMFAARLILILLLVTTALLQAAVQAPQTDTEFLAAMDAAGSTPVVVDYFAVWCGPCKVIAPVFDSLSANYPSLVFLTADVDKLTDASAEVRALPTFDVYINKEKVSTLLGANPAAVKELVEKYANQPQE